MVFTGIVEQHQKISSHHKIQIDTFSIFSHQTFQELLDNNLVMGQIQLPPSNHENIKIDNATINHLQCERTWLIEHLLYLHSVDNLLVTWSNNICQMALDSVPTTKGDRWMIMWLRNLESLK